MKGKCGHPLEERMQHYATAFMFDWTAEQFPA